MSEIPWQFYLDLERAQKHVSDLEKAYDQAASKSDWDEAEELAYKIIKEVFK